MRTFPVTKNLFPILKRPCKTIGSRLFFSLFLFLALFEEITFPLGPRSLVGSWIICAQDWPSIIDETASKYCIDFHVKDQKESQPETEDDGKNDKSTRLLEAGSSSADSQGRHLINLTFEAADTFRPGVPFSGKVRAI